MPVLRPECLFQTAGARTIQIGNAKRTTDRTMPTLTAPDGTILIGKSHKAEVLTLKLANRHGLVTGATGTGKTVTLQTMAEEFSKAGVPVFAADIKGDLSGIAAPGRGEAHFVKRCEEIGVEYKADVFPVTFWDLFGDQGHPIRTTIAEMGPLLLSRLLQLNEVQEGVLNILFRYCDENKLLLLDLKDLRAMLAEFGSNKALQGELMATYGNVTPQTVGAIQRQLLVLETQGADRFFGEPALDILDLMKTDAAGRGMVNILAADKLMESPRLYATFLLWLLTELFQELPEVGDLPKPKLVFFFDEAHLLFSDAPKALLEKIEQVVRLIRSKGVGVYFVTQNPLDVPETVLSQLGNRVQHALRAFTPRDQKAVKSAADTFRQNPKFRADEVITQLAVGEALISTLEGKGTPSIVERTLVKPPMGRVGPLAIVERAAIVSASPMKGAYDETIDNESAYEMLKKRVEEQAAQPGDGGILDTIGGWLGGGPAPKTGPGSRGGRVPPSMAEKVITSAARSAATSVGRQIGTAIFRSVLGSILKQR